MTKRGTRKGLAGACKQVAEAALKAGKRDSALQQYLEALDSLPPLALTDEEVGKYVGERWQARWPLAVAGRQGGRP